MKPSELRKSLQDISLAMSDGYMFLQVRSLLEGVNSQAENGDEAAKELMLIVSRFDKLLKLATN